MNIHTSTKRLILCLISLIMILTLGACGNGGQDSSGRISGNSATAEAAGDSVILGLKKTGELELSYATQFSVDEYGDYRLITIGKDQRFLVVPEGADIPDKASAADANITILRQPLDRTYLVSTSVMDLIRELGAIGSVRLSGCKAVDWYIDDAKKAMADGRLLYAGKYSAPDFELLLSEGCSLAIENTMILHNPGVKEKLEELGIPVLIEYSSYEKHPLGRLEWIKLYGVLFGKEETAVNYYNNQLALIEPILQKKPTEKTVAFFSVNSAGSIVVRKPQDYISKMIELSGGTYALSDVLPEEENALSTMNMQMEDFYAAAKDADILIYNSTIDGEIDSVSDLISKNSLFENFDAVKSGQLYCTGKNFFQETTGMAEFMNDLNKIMNGSDDNLVYIKHVD